MNMQRGKAVGTPLDDDRASRECPQTRLRPVAFIWGAARCSLTADHCQSGLVGGQEGGKGGSRGLGGESGSSPDPCRVSRENTGRREARFGNLLGQMIRRVGGDAVRALHARPCKCRGGEPHRGRSRAAWRVVGAPGPLPARERNVRSPTSGLEASPSAPQVTARSPGNGDRPVFLAVYPRVLSVSR